MTVRRVAFARVAIGLVVAIMPVLAFAQSESGNQVPSRSEVDRLTVQIEQQQRQIDELRVVLEHLGQVASTTAMVPAATPPPPVPFPAAQLSSGPEAKSPLSLQVGSAFITPVGFMDFTSVFRTTNVGSGIGTNFGGIPFNNVPAGRLTEERLSAQNSRAGFRVDAKVKGARVTGYLEGDFLGTTPTNVAVTSNSDGFRMRVYWVNVRKGKFEVLGGQSWSLLTPGRKGISGIPGDLFYSQVVDTNYQVGLTWSRDPQLRFVYHPRETVALALSLENPEQYIGGSSGGGTATLPASLAAPYANQLNSGGNNLVVPNLHPDIIGKMAFDPVAGGRSHHIEFAGLYSTFKVYNPLTQKHLTSSGGGASVNLNLELVRNFRAIVNTFYSYGGGRWLFGQGPDVIIRADGSPSPLHASGGIGGFEYQAAPNSLLYAYYGVDYFAKNVAVDSSSGKPVLAGYGYAGSPGGQNRSIQEPTFGLTQTLWKSPNYGALMFMAQYSYLVRNPWNAGTGPKNAHSSMVFLNLRYQLPGAPPTIK